MGVKQGSSKRKCPVSFRRLSVNMKLDALPTPAFWTDAYTPWTPGGLIGIAVLDTLAESLGARIDHDPLL